MCKNATHSLPRLPQFLIVGARKAGTTSLDYYLSQHPEIFLPKGPIEPHFFIADTIRHLNVSDHVYTYQKYVNLFISAKETQLIGEGSTGYLHFHEKAIPAIKKHLGNEVSIIIILREPVSRCISDYQFVRRLGIEKLSFESALLKEKERSQVASQYQYTWYSIYSPHVKAYLENFDRVHICFQEDLDAHPQKTVKEIFRFLKVDENFVTDFSVRRNVGGWMPGNQRIYNFLMRFELFYRYFKNVIISIPFLHKLCKKIFLDVIIGRIKLKIKPETEKQLKDYFRNDVLELQKITGRDLSHWLK
ncbi:MAG: hypothetical protein A3H98_08720 [Bacteroidetes bacterium RIFCSPLOWO2_02_FULL_36_8]|nr:MAG: hypothetical protein A3H98_08720 [Bacteroidetes bacterium RIFCSPLOWO2_02_FULL_36_8]OFY70921.1 MAG: hypothetical protein A3G23_12435 [Bacteroidetes bacterium RIFCSPLOWO2_12_FULL_37_12]